MFARKRLRDLFGIGFTVWEYSTADSISEVLEDGYFNNANPTQQHRSQELHTQNLKAGDWIFARVAEGPQILVVDQADKFGIVVSQYRPIPVAKIRKPSRDIASTEE